METARSKFGCIEQKGSGQEELIESARKKFQVFWNQLHGNDILVPKAGMPQPPTSAPVVSIHIDARNAALRAVTG